MNSVKEFIRKNGTAAVYVIIFQITSLLPAPFWLALPGYPGLITKQNALSVLFDIGFAALPRAEALALSYFYRVTANEIAVFFVLLGVAFAFGVAMKKLLGAPKTAKAATIFLIILLIADLILRALPFAFNTTFGTTAAIIGAVIRMMCLVLLIVDLKRNNNQQISD